MMSLDFRSVFSESSLTVTPSVKMTGRGGRGARAGRTGATGADRVGGTGRGAVAGATTAADDRAGSVRTRGAGMGGEGLGRAVGEDVLGAGTTESAREPPVATGRFGAAGATGGDAALGS